MEVLCINTGPIAKGNKIYRTRLELFQVYKVRGEGNLSTGISGYLIDDKLSDKGIETSLKERFVELTDYNKEQIIYLCKQLQSLSLVDS